MPLGSRTNNFAGVICVSFIVASVVVSIIGMRISNKQVVDITHKNQDVMIRQNEQLISEHAEELKILHRIEARYLDGVPK